MAVAANKILTLSVVATAALTQARAVTGNGAIPAAGARCLGFADFNAAVGERVSVGAMGTVAAEAGAAIVVDALVEVDAQGRVVTKAAGVAVGRALTASTAAGQFIEILLIPN
jgi:hypothetical protein